MHDETCAARKDDRATTTQQNKLINNDKRTRDFESREPFTDGKTYTSVLFSRKL